ncbi:SMC-Scp complex subunit ScpB [Terriglobus aquaticus]|uniref:SMC-Scp complex subunit ScpB n=1 Tax=Terriglobus aquaticus TaxID=940139 RepID=A0ABW9KMI2_9BACT|nr:SMC-Scp complex subunit ScpB [Terriglobus aquaticus]
MSLKSKIEAVIYASEEPVTLAQLVVLLSEEAQSELDALAARQSQLPLTTMTPDSVETAPADPEEVDAAGSQPAPEIDTADAESNAPTSDPEAESSISPEAELIESAAGIEIYGQTSDEPEQLPEPEVPSESGPEPAATTSDADKRSARERERAVREYLRSIVDALIREYAESDRGIEIREVAGGFRFGTKPEYHDAVRGFVKSLKPALKLSLQALETLAVVAYKQPVTAAEISEIRGVDSAGVLGGLLTRKLIQTAGRKQVIGRPMLYKTTKEFLVRFGLRDIQELPSMEEFERMAGELAEQEDLPMESTDSVIERANARGDAEHIREANGADEAASPAEEAGRAPDSAEEPTELTHAETTETPEPENSASSSPRAEAEPEGAEQDPA